MSDKLIAKRVPALAAITSESWNKLLPDTNPFLRHEYLYGLETGDCLRGQGWEANHIVIRSGNTPVGAMPLYLRTNSYGEFVFDWAWADAYERAGGRYYPKIVAAIPFAPVIGPRLLVQKDHPGAESIRRLLVEQVIDMTKSAELSSFHCLFNWPDDQAILEEYGLLQRKTVQFHWHNHQYRDFQDFLDSISSKKRKQIKRERKHVRENNIEIEVLRGKDISTRQWHAFHDFYCSTFYRRWGSPRLTLAFFQALGETMPDNTLLILARHKDNYVAGAFAMIDQETVYGRHWGCSEQFPFLHFELCYYQTIDYCINNHLKRVDAGVQGEHKVTRGFQPVAGLSYHWIRHPGFRQAVQEYLQRETREIDRYVADLMKHLPFKNPLE